MSNIPTKGQLDANQQAAAAAAAAARIPADVKYFTDAIVAEMQKGKSSYSEPTRNVSAPVEQQLRANFASSGWTLTIRNFRTGCAISWS